MALVQTDFNRQGINALNQGLGIGQAFQRTEQLGIDRQRQSEMDVQRNQRFESQQGIMGQQSQLNQQSIEQNEQTQGMGELITALNLPFDKRQELFAELESKKTNPAAKKYMAHLQTLDDKEQLVSLVGLLNSQQGGKKDSKTSGIKDFEYYSELKRTDPEAARQFGMANKILSGDGEIIMKTGDVNTINNGVSKLTTEYKAIRSAAKSLERLGELKTGPAQMAIIFKFMKSLDPESTVRESEYDAARDTAGIGEKAWNIAHKALNGVFLSENQVSQFIDAAKTLANAKGEDVRSTVGDYLNTYDITDARRERFMKTARVNPFKIKTTSAKERTDGVVKIDANGNKAMVYPDGTFKEL